jgi:hypothetical protein
MAHMLTALQPKTLRPTIFTKTLEEMIAAGSEVGVKSAAVIPKVTGLDLPAAAAKDDASSYTSEIKEISDLPQLQTKNTGLLERSRSIPEAAAVFAKQMGLRRRCRYVSRRRTHPLRFCDVAKVESGDISFPTRSDLERAKTSIPTERVAVDSLLEHEAVSLETGFLSLPEDEVVSFRDDYSIVFMLVTQWSIKDLITGVLSCVLWGYIGWVVYGWSG